MYDAPVLYITGSISSLFSSSISDLEHFTSNSAFLVFNLLFRYLYIIIMYISDVSIFPFSSTIPTLSASPSTPNPKSYPSSTTFLAKSI